MTANPTQGAEPYTFPFSVHDRMTSRPSWCLRDGLGRWVTDSEDLSDLVWLRDRLNAAPPPPVNASAIDAWKAAEEIHEAVVALSWARDGDFVPAVAAIILRHSAAPGLRLTEEERERFLTAWKRWAVAEPDDLRQFVRDLVTIIDRLAPTGPTQEEK